MGPGKGVEVRGSVCVVWQKGEDAEADVGGGLHGTETTTTREDRRAAGRAWGSRKLAG